MRFYKIFIAYFFKLSVVCLLSALGASCASMATTLQSLTLEELVAESRLIFIGTVVGRHTEIEGRLVYTWIDFAVEEHVVVGPGEEETQRLSLRFLGGELPQGKSVWVEETYIPKVGEQAVWFVEETEAHMVNPLTGWQQGVYPIEQNPEGKWLLNLQERPDILLQLLPEDPLLRKLVGMRASEDLLAANMREYERFSLSDFTAAIRAIYQRQGGRTTLQEQMQ
jgi:hypothetical protein